MASNPTSEVSEECKHMLKWIHRTISRKLPLRHGKEGLRGIEIFYHLSAFICPPYYIIRPLLMNLYSH